MKLSFAKKTVDSVMSAFNQAIVDLQDVQNRETQAADDMRRQAAELDIQAAQATAVARRAANVQAKLQALVTA